jgi:hypothetical protein
MPLVLVWFTGAGMKERADVDKKFIKELAERIGFALYPKLKTSVKVECDVTINTDFVWAKYNNEVGAKYPKTCKDDAVINKFNKSAGHLYDEIKNGIVKGDKFLFCGTSNGCIQAHEFAKEYSKITHVKDQVVGCIFHSGCPPVNIKNCNRPPPLSTFPNLMILPVIRGEDNLWDNHINTYKAAHFLRSGVLHFDKCHADFPSAKACSDSFMGVYNEYHRSHQKSKKILLSPGGKKAGTRKKKVTFSKEVVYIAA